MREVPNDNLGFSLLILYESFMIGTPHSNIFFKDKLQMLDMMKNMKQFLYDHHHISLQMDIYNQSLIGILKNMLIY